MISKQARLYSFSFAQQANWPSFFPAKNVIQNYMAGVAHKFDLDRRAKFQHIVETARFDEENAHWIVDVKDMQTGQTKQHTSRIFFSCVGSLSVPRDCDIKGADTFKGPIFHSARWRTDVPMKDKKVVLVGNGCTAAQIVPNMAEDVKQLTQIVRAKHWIVPQLQNPFEGAFNEKLERILPGYTTFERFAVTVLCESHFLQTFIQDGKGARARFAAVSREYVQRCAPKEYHDMIIPRPGELEVSCKRRIYDDGYIVALGRPNVELTNDQAAEIVPDGVILQSGRKIEADVIVLANGFKPGMASQLEIINGKGQRLEKYWKDVKGSPQAYRSMLCSTFPNLFLIWGPNSVTGHFSAVFAIESAVEMATKILRPVFLTGSMDQAPLVRSHGKSIRVKPEAEDLEQDFIQNAMKGLIFTTGCGSWYTDEHGKVTAVNPSFQTTVAWRSKFPNYNDFIYKGVSQQQAWQSWTILTKIGTILRLGATPSVPGENRHGILYRLLTLPYRILHYLLSRMAIRSLQTLSFVIDTLFRYKKPMPYAGPRALIK
jgi:cation diffusion facilitator CzcD-associated flavoprotein CzcO